MLYPQLNAVAEQRLYTQQFVGLDRRPRTNEGAFADMENMTGDPWPLLCSRRKRGLVRTIGDPRGMLALGKLAWIDGSTLYFDGQATPVNDLSLEADMLPKQMVSMGAYIIVFPDGAYYNTVDASDHGSMNRYFSSAGPVTIDLCTMDGIDFPREKLTVSDQAPEEKEDGDYWLDTSGEKHYLYQWRDLYEEWIGVSSVYVRISAAGIGRGLNVQDNVTISGVTYTGTDEAMRKQLEFLNETHIVQAVAEDFLVVIGVIDQRYIMEEGSIRADRKAPNMDFVFECNNRLWGCRYGEQDGETVNRIYATALGDFKNWRKYMGTSQDSYYVNVGTEGPFTGAAAHNGYPYFFKENYVHKIYGDMPSNYQMQTTVCEGVKEGSGKTLLNVGGALYYVGLNGVEMFSSMPEHASQALGAGKLSGGAAGAIDGKYYLSVMEESGAYSLYVLDAARGIWHREDESRALAFARVDDELYMLLEDGRLYALNGSEGTQETDIAWWAESPVVGYEYPDFKTLSRFNLRMKLGADATFRTLIQYDSSGEWVDKGTVTGGGKVRTYTLPIVPRRCDHLKIRIEGTGDMQLYTFARILRVGADG